LALEHALGKLSHIEGSIRLSFLAKPVRQVFFEIACINGSIGILQYSLTFFGALIPLTIIYGSISPLAESLPSHLALDPLSLVLPALYRTNKETLTLLETVDVVSFVKITIFPLSNTTTIRETRFELTQVDFALT
jgi:hypothetical protein